jgi:signal transduction histidine kinase/CheY-like chemotaxis protein
MSEQRPDSPITPLQAEVEDRFGVLPNFFRLAPGTPEIAANLWGFAKFGYLDNPLPSLFKERLFVYLSRFCEVRYCIARHVGFLVGLGRPAGDRQSPPETVEQVGRLISRPLPRGDALEPHQLLLETCAAPLGRLPEPDTPAEEAVFSCATHVFLQTPQAARCLEALRRALDGRTFEHLLTFLAFVRTAHFWTKVHPELGFEDDIQQLLATHETLAECVLNDPEAAACEITPVLLDELVTLRRERALREDLERANQALRESEERLREQDRRKDEYLATLAHELRNPLAPIRSGLEVLRLGPSAESAARVWEMVERQLGQMVRLVDDLLDVSRISQGKIELRRERIDLAAVASHALEAVRPACEAMGHQLVATLPSEPVYLIGDAARLVQVSVNLLHNSCKFTPRGGRIGLTVERNGQHACLRVQDNGIGIAEDQLAEIFELFSQADKSLERSRSGLGIGLTLVKRLVEMHGGTVEARSAGAGQGSELTVALPGLDEPSERLRQEPAAAEPTAPASRRILVVDDNRDAADSLALLLQLAGHEVHTAHDGLEAVNAAARLRPEVILLDIGLPKLNGYEAASRIREQQGASDLLLVALTGWGQDEDRRRSEQAGFDAHMVKPVDLAALNKLLCGPVAGG